MFDGAARQWIASIFRFNSERLPMSNTSDACGPGQDPQRAHEPGLTPDENLLLTTQLPHDLAPAHEEIVWSGYQSVIGQLLTRMGRESPMLDSVARAMLVRSVDGVYARFSLLPKLGRSAMHVLERYAVGEAVYRVAGEFSLMELSAAAGYRTFCLPDLIKGLLRTGKMKNRPVDRMMDTFEFLNTMVQQPLNSERVREQLARTNGLHGKYKVAGSANNAARDLFKYIALNMFYIGPSMRPDITPNERRALCGLTILVANRMGHSFTGSVRELDAFIAEYEAANMFDRADNGVLRRRAVEIAQASKLALYQIPTISPARIHSYVPYGVKRILEIE
jgi:hypothetical protein